MLEKIFNRKFSAEQKRKFTLVGISSLLVSVVLIVGFGVSSKEDEEEQQTEQTTGFNADIPAPAKDEINGDKTTTATSNRGRSEEDKEVIKNMEEMMKAQTEAVQQSIATNPKADSARESIKASSESYKSVNRTLSNFYDRPKVDQEKKQMEEEIEELKLQIKMQNQQPQPMGVDEQMAIIEKSYEMAAKYNGAESEERVVNHKRDSTSIDEVRKVGGSLVSSLSAQSSRGFNTAVATAAKAENNTFEACIHSDRTIRNGEKVQIRLLETMIIGKTEVPKGSVITGMGDISGERLNIEITQIEVDGMIIPTKLRVIDTDGLDGVHIPATKEVGALKEIVANMSGSMGTTVNLTNQSAGDQILTNLGTSAIDGVSQYVADKIREVKVHLKSGYRVLLYQEKQ